MDVLAGSTSSLSRPFVYRNPNSYCSPNSFQLQMLSCKSLPVRLVKAHIWSPLSCVRKISRSMSCNGFDDSGSSLNRGSLLADIKWRLNKNITTWYGLFSIGCRSHFIIPREYIDSLQRLINCSEKFRPHVSILFIRLVGMVLVMSLSFAVSKTPSWALSEENLLFLEAWRTIDRAYIDKNFNGQSWFRYRENALRNEPMNTREETYIAIRKMLGTLGDPFTRFLEPDKFKSLRSGTQGSLTGVGLSIGYPTRIDKSSTGLVVISASPGGPANRAGILPGDIILAIDNSSTETMGIYDAADRLQ